MDNPCVKDCPRRSATCHSSCPEYAKFDQYNQMRREESRMKTILFDRSPFTKGEIQEKHYGKVKEGNKMTLKQALWEIVRDENIIITNQNIDWLLDRAEKRVNDNTDKNKLKSSILERKEKLDKLGEPELLINQTKSNNFEVKSNNSQCIDCIHSEICQFYNALGAKVICYPCGFYEAKSNEELFKQALVEGVNRRIDKTIEEAKQIEEMARTLCGEKEQSCAECEMCYRCEFWCECSVLHHAGYRKQSDVVRCKDCHYCYQVGNIKACRHWNSHSTTDDAYCSYAKMKGGEE